MKLNLTGWNQLTIGQKVDRDLEVYKNVIGWIGKNLDVVVACVWLACFVGLIFLLKLMMVPFELAQ